MDSKHILDLWMHENTIVNQKTAYYFTSAAILAWLVAYAATNHLPRVAVALSLLGVVLSAFSFALIARTIAYRNHWRNALASTSEYGELLASESIKFRWYQNFSSNKMLMLLPIFGLTVWTFVLFYFIPQ